MAATPRWKIYTDVGDYCGCMKCVEDCVRVVAGRPGYTIRDGHRRVVWTEGKEIQSAAESYDYVAETVYSRLGTNTAGNIEKR